MSPEYRELRGAEPLKGHVCEDCGSVVVDREAHDRFHVATGVVRGMANLSDLEKKPQVI